MRPANNWRSSSNESGWATRDWDVRGGLDFLCGAARRHGFWLDFSLGGDPPRRQRRVQRCVQASARSSQRSGVSPHMEQAVSVSQRGMRWRRFRLTRNRDEGMCGSTELGRQRSGPSACYRNSTEVEVDATGGLINQNFGKSGADGLRGGREGALRGCVTHHR